MIAVTTFSRTGYESYAKKMLESCVENWPTKIVVYTESPLNLDHEKLEERNFFEIPGVPAFYQYLQNTPMARGLVNGGYNYNYDAWKFTRKVFAQWDTLKNYEGKVIWLDADTYVRKPVSVEWIESLFDGKALSYLGREGLYTETGFLGFDTKADRFKEFLDLYIGCLRRGVVFTLKRWHDCEVFDWAMKHSGVSGNNLSPFFKIPDDKKMTLEDLDVFSRSVLGEYLLHFKGKRKDAYQ